MRARPRRARPRRAPGSPATDPRVSPGEDRDRGSNGHGPSAVTGTIGQCCAPVVGSSSAVQVRYQPSPGTRSARSQPGGSERAKLAGLRASTRHQAVSKRVRLMRARPRRDAQAQPQEVSGKNCCLWKKLGHPRADGGRGRQLAARSAWRGTPAHVPSQLGARKPNTLDCRNGALTPARGRPPTTTVKHCERAL
jgi:hypothetical protein